ncbi:hypothetical protein BHYA_0072g00330 [Botrytis hyacinthi]|uniref:Uncharacterized protein n=1 Tax=Botrytis hyacinthi TaxID=278943 RepID=A0A4Z1GTV3_9HELO|nr:hypothetical protein BHYA_0072g00330 [Botrytis hyacinthi]
MTKVLRSIEGRNNAIVALRIEGSTNHECEDVRLLNEGLGSMRVIHKKLFRGYKIKEKLAPFR